MIRGFLTEIRPRQWTKNLVVFAALIFSENLGNGALVFQSILAFASLCLLSGSIYVLNDLADLEQDRHNPLKSDRPIASGVLSQAQAVTGLLFVLGLGLALAAATGRNFLITVCAFVLLNVAYTYFLKRIVILDVFGIALSFILRAISGVEALLPIDPDIELSPWLLVCTLFLALFLGFAKRRHEFIEVDDPQGRREVLDGYNLPLLDQLVALAAAASLLAYTIYTIWPGTLEKFGTPDLIYTVPIVAFGVMRYLYLVFAKNAGGDPSEALLTDKGIFGSVVVWVLCVLSVFYLRG